MPSQIALMPEITVVGATLAAEIAHLRDHDFNEWQPGSIHTVSMTTNWRDLDLLLPPTVPGALPFDCDWTELDWLNDLPPGTFVALFLMWPSMEQFDLPPGHDLYVVSYNFEPFDIDWVHEQANRIKAPILVLNEGSVYDYPLPPNVYHFEFYTWHLQMDRILEFHPYVPTTPIIPKHTCSAICNRLTQSKVLTFAALARYHDLDSCLVKLGSWLEPKNVHDWHSTGDPELDELMRYFREHWLGQTLQPDDWQNDLHNNYRDNCDPWQPFYRDAALHFTNESYHYSYMEDAHGRGIRPGPNLSEKTFKPLIAGTAFVPVGQFDTYGCLRALGFEFDYGGLDLSWDQVSGNLDRLKGIVRMIESLRKFSAQDLWSMTKGSSEANQNHVLSGQFRRCCQAKNEQTVAEILARFGAGH
jgi:hypothetical protein